MIYTYKIKMKTSRIKYKLIKNQIKIIYFMKMS